MIALLMICGTTNFVLGMFLAVWVSRADEHLTVPSWKELQAAVLARIRPQSKATEEPEAPDTESKPDQPPTDQAAAVQALLTPEWQQQLAASELKPLSFVEAAAQVLRLGVLKHREQFIVAEQQARSLQGVTDAAAVTRLRDDLQAFQKEWLEVQKDAAAKFAEQHGKMGDYEEAGRAVEELLLDQSAQLETAINGLGSLDIQHEPALAVKQLIEQLARVLDGVHAVRERSHDLLGTILRAESRQAELTPAMQLDAATGLPNRLGLERVLWEWQQEDATHVKESSICLLDLDRFGKLNERLGTRTGDRLLVGFCNEMMQFLRRDRGFDRLVRLEGQRLLLFLGETNPKQALACVERIRQSLEAMTFDCGGTNTELTLSASIREWRYPEPAAAAIGRLKTLLAEVKQAGRNKVIVEENGHSTMVEPPRYPVQSRVVPVTME